MSTENEKAFHKAIREAVLLREPGENPDFANMGIYADWLEDQGDLRSELIRLQVRMEQLRLDSTPDAMIEKAELERREQKLFAGSKKENRPPVHKIWEQKINEIYPDMGVEPVSFPEVNQQGKRQREKGDMFHPRWDYYCGLPKVSISFENMAEHGDKLELPGVLVYENSKKGLKKQEDYEQYGGTLENLKRFPIVEVHITNNPLETEGHVFDYIEYASNKITLLGRNLLSTESADKDEPKLLSFEFSKMGAIFASTVVYDVDDGTETIRHSLIDSLPAQEKKEASNFFNICKNVERLGIKNHRADNFGEAFFLEGTKCLCFNGVYFGLYYKIRDVFAQSHNALHTKLTPAKTLTELEVTNSFVVNETTTTSELLRALIGDGERNSMLNTDLTFLKLKYNVLPTDIGGFTDQCALGQKLAYYSMEGSKLSSFEGIPNSANTNILNSQNYAQNWTGDDAHSKMFVNPAGATFLDGKEVLPSVSKGHGKGK